MKKLLLTTFVLTAIPALAYDGLPTIPVTAVSPMHEMQTLQEQRFRQEQINYYNDVQEEKARYKKKNQTDEERIQEVKQQIQQAGRQKIDSKSQFVQENGQLKIKYTD